VPGRIQSRKKPLDIKEAEPRVPKLEKLQLTVAPSNSKGAEILGEGEAAVPALIEVLKKIGILA
jgi:electron transfer flavoprotein beta subunit